MHTGFLMVIIFFVGPCIALWDTLASDAGFQAMDEDVDRR